MRILLPYPSARTLIKSCSIVKVGDRKAPGNCVVAPTLEGIEGKSWLICLSLPLTKMSPFDEGD